MGAAKCEKFLTRLKVELVQDCLQSKIGIREAARKGGVARETIRSCVRWVFDRLYGRYQISLMVVENGRGEMD